MLRVSVSYAARQDLEDILYYSIANFGETTASQYRADLDAAIVSIGGDPRIGRPTKMRKHSYRRLSCRSHGIFYTSDANGVTVIRVLHLAMDFVRHLPR